jgi:RNA recognition motif-containing protein
MAHYFRSGILIVNIYVGNLSYQVTDADLRAAFETFGEVSSATVIKDKYTYQSKGFGFVEMSRQADAEAAIKALNSTDLKGRSLAVNMARPRSEAPRRNEGFGGRHRRS